MKKTCHLRVRCISPMSIACRSPVTVTDVRHLASRCNANDNYCFQSMRVRRRHSLGITMCWPLYRNICRIQDDRFYGDHLLKITREIFINAIPTMEFGQFKVESCLLMRPKSNMEKERCNIGGGVAYMIIFMEYNMLGKQNISLLIIQERAMLISIMI